MSPAAIRQRARYARGRDGIEIYPLELPSDAVGRAMVAWGFLSSLSEDVNDEQRAALQRFVEAIMRGEIVRASVR